jgi:hypothetical protein
METSESDPALQLNFKLVLNGSVDPIEDMKRYEEFLRRTGTLRTEEQLAELYIGYDPSTY